MKNYYNYFIFYLLISGFSVNAIAQEKQKNGLASTTGSNCTNIILRDSFNLTSKWQSQGSGDVYVGSGKCNFANVYDGNYNRVYRDLGTTLSDTYWKAETDFSILSTNPSGNGVGEELMSLTAGTLDFMSYDASLSYAETDQDGICVVFNSPSTTDNNINDWQFLIEAKKGSVRTYTTSYISASSSISNYYIRLERTSSGMTQLSVFSDAAHTTHLSGSPITFAIDPTITGLNTIQHGCSTAGYYTRLINATVDNDLICDDAVTSVCAQVVLRDSFALASKWQSQGSGDVYVGSGKCNFANVYDGYYNRVYRGLGTTLSDKYWKAETDFSILSTNPSGNGVGEELMSLTAGTLDFMSYDASMSYAETDQDGICVVFNSPSTTDNNINDWQFLIEAKKGSVRTYTTSYISASSSISNYYIRLERISSGMTQLSVYSDAARTTHLPGSPITFAIDSTITGLNTIQHGCSTAGYYTRLINATIDNDLICEGSPNGDGNTGINEFADNGLFRLYPNPNNGSFTFSYQGLENVKNELRLIDMLGNIVGVFSINGSQGQLNMNERSLDNGVYFYQLVANDRILSEGKIMILK